MTSGAAPQRQALCRFSSFGGTGTVGTCAYMFNAYHTMVGRHAEGFPTELEARLDAEHVRQEIATAPITGEVYEGARGV